MIEEECELLQNDFGEDAADLKSAEQTRFRCCPLLVCGDAKTSYSLILSTALID